MSWEKEVRGIEQRRQLARELGGPEAVAKQHDRGRLTVRERAWTSCSTLTLEKKGDPLEVLLRRAFGQSREVSVTLHSGKAYVGRIADLFNPAYDVQYIELFLTHSGYRTEADKRLVLVNDYREKAGEIFEP